jgi:acetyl-CoA acetyltransferase
MSTTWEDLDTKALLAAAMSAGLDRELDATPEEIEAIRLGAEEGDEDVRRGLLDYLHAVDPHPVLD